MKKLFAKVLIIALVLTNIMLLTSCGKSSESAEQLDNPNTSEAPPPGAFGQNQADLYGEVKSISGNEITVALLEMPQRRQLTDEERQQMQENRENSPQNQRRANNSDNNPNSGNTVNNEGTGNASPGTNGSGRPRGGGFGGFMGERKLTGETQKITVADGTPITTFGRGNGDFQETELKLSDVKAGSIIQVWYKEGTGDNKEVDHIRIMQVQEQN